MGGSSSKKVCLGTSQPEDGRVIYFSMIIVAGHKTFIDGES